MGQTTSADVFTSRSAGVLNIIPENVWERQIHMRQTNHKVNTNPEEYSLVLKDGKLKDPNNSNNKTNSTKRPMKRKKRKPRPAMVEARGEGGEGGLPSHRERSAASVATTSSRSSPPSSSSSSSSLSAINRRSVTGRNPQELPNSVRDQQQSKVKVPLPRRAKTVSSSSSLSRDLRNNNNAFPNPENEEESFEQLIETTYLEQQQRKRRPPLPHPVLYSPSSGTPPVSEKHLQQHNEPQHIQEANHENDNNNNNNEDEDSVPVRTPRRKRVPIPKRPSISSASTAPTTVPNPPPPPSSSSSSRSFSTTLSMNNHLNAHNNIHEQEATQPKNNNLEKLEKCLMQFPRYDDNVEEYQEEATANNNMNRPSSGVRSFAPSAMTKDSAQVRRMFGVDGPRTQEEDHDIEDEDIDDENIDEENDDEEVDDENVNITVSPRSGELTGTPRNRPQDATSSQTAEQPTSKVVIIDFGHQTTKVGFSHEDRPRVVIPSCYNIEEDPRNNNQKTIKFGGTVSLQHSVWFFKHGKFTFSRHDEQGREIFVAFVRYIAKVLLGLKDAFKGKTVMIALPYIFGEDKDQMVMLCETFFHPSIQAKSLFLCGTPLFSFISAAANHITENRSTALSVTVGHGISQVIPIVDGCPFSTCGVSSVVGGALQGEYLVTLIKREVEREGVTLDDSLISYESVEKEKITNCSLVKSFRLNKKRPNECKAKFFKKTMNPVKGVIEQVLDHRCLCPEFLFTPRLYEKGRPIVKRHSDPLSPNADSAQLSSTEEPPMSAQSGSSTTSTSKDDDIDQYLGVVALIESCLKKCPKEFHELLLSNVVVSGGPSQIRNFVEVSVWIEF
ncbi:hypothetical protein FDP41_004888 [Naegleria fowleri]|uniref:Uncharacterized protein n=1 Tax=Naegleria fowleri TaxID=5763 RepID=A0A6A5BED3_NAEFO|nr:uncharacterized protein FDP41_004888 [Naegleria fowleri]KAF0976213.1 hypothetical protein FDP41_004888 [Naegleria fowleri]